MTFNIARSNHYKKCEVVSKQQGYIEVAKNRGYNRMVLHGEQKKEVQKAQSKKDTGEKKEVSKE